MTIKATVEELRSTTTYLADILVPGALAWMPYATDRDMVVQAAHAASYREQLDQYVANRNVGARAPQLPPPAALSAIARLSTDGFFLTANGKPRRDGIVESTLATAFAEDPCTIPQLCGSFAVTASNVSRICAGYFPSKEKGRVCFASKNVSSVVEGGRLKIIHKLFERNPVKVGRRSTSVLQQDEVEFAIEEWPVTSQKMRDELNELNGSHFVAPIPVYDRFGHLIDPKDYERYLCGAVVKLYYSLKHQLRSGKHKFFAEINKIVVLIPPTPPVNPLKRKRVSREER